MSYCIMKNEKAVHKFINTEESAREILKSMFNVMRRRKLSVTLQRNGGAIHLFENGTRTAIYSVENES